MDLLKTAKKSCFLLLYILELYAWGASVRYLIFLMLVASPEGGISWYVSNFKGPV